MSKEELDEYIKNYITENLTITAYVERDMGGDFIRVELDLDDVTISEDIIMISEIVNN